MTKRIKKINPLQLGKVLAVTYGLLALIIVPIFLLFAAIAGVASRGQGGPPGVALFGMGIGFAICAPILYAVLGFVGGVVGAFIYNLVATWIGGIEIEVE